MEYFLFIISNILFYISLFYIFYSIYNKNTTYDKKYKIKYKNSSQNLELEPKSESEIEEIELKDLASSIDYDDMENGNQLIFKKNNTSATNKSIPLLLQAPSSSLASASSPPISSSPISSSPVSSSTSPPVLSSTSPPVLSLPVSSPVSSVSSLSITCNMNNMNENDIINNIQYILEETSDDFQIITMKNN